MRPSLRVLTYHRVLAPGEARGCNPALISATPAVFDRQMRYLAARCRAVSVWQLLDALRGRGPLPERAVLITFDDACRDFGEVAWPILRRHGLPALVFVPTAFPGDPARAFWWERLYRAFTGTPRVELFDPYFGKLPLGTPKARAASLRFVQRVLKATPHAEAMRQVDRLCRGLGEAAVPPAEVLGWDAVRRLAREGVAFGAHTRTHPALTQLPLEEARAEIEQSRDDLARELGRSAPVFAYPFGDHDDRLARLVRDAGFELALTCLDGHNAWPFSDPWRLRRTNVTRRTTPLIFRARLTGWGASIDRWRHRSPARAASPARGLERTDAPPDAPRVAYIMSRFPKLSETFVLNEMSALAAAGARVELYPLLRESCRVTHPGVDEWVRRARYEPFVSWRILKAHAHFIRHRPAAYLAVWTEVLRETWGSANFFIGALGTLPKAIRFAYDMRRRGVTHVHAHFATHPAVAALAIRRLTGIPFSFTAHGSDLHVDRRMLRTKVEAAAFAVTISEFNRDVIVRECGERLRDRIHVVHCGVDTDCFTPPPAGGRSGPFRIVCVASLEEIKGHAYLVEACRLLRDRSVDFRCHLIGDGPERRRLARQIAASGLGALVHVHGGQPRPEVVRHLSAADAAVLASHPTRGGKREGIPVALMEAMAAGLPVVATAISGIPELVESGVHGWLVPSGDPGALADALERLQGDPDLRGRMGRAARRRVLHEFDLHASAARLLALIRAQSESAEAAPRPAVPLSA